MGRVNLDQVWSELNPMSAGDGGSSFKANEWKPVI